MPIGGHASFTLWPASAVSIWACDPYIDGPLVATLDPRGDPGVLSWLEEGLFALTTFGGVAAIPFFLASVPSRSLNHESRDLIF